MGVEVRGGRALVDLGKLGNLDLDVARAVLVLPFADYLVCFEVLVANKIGLVAINDK